MGVQKLFPANCRNFRQKRSTNLTFWPIFFGQNYSDGKKDPLTDNLTSWMTFFGTWGLQGFRKTIFPKRTRLKRRNTQFKFLRQRNHIVKVFFWIFFPTKTCLSLLRQKLWKLCTGSLTRLWDMGVKKTIYGEVMKSAKRKKHNEHRKNTTRPDLSNRAFSFPSESINKSNR